MFQYNYLLNLIDEKNYKIKNIFLNYKFTDADKQPVEYEII